MSAKRNIALTAFFLVWFVFLRYYVRMRLGAGEGNAFHNKIQHDPASDRFHLLPEVSSSATVASTSSTAPQTSATFAVVRIEDKGTSAMSTVAATTAAAAQEAGAAVQSEPVIVHDLGHEVGRKLPPGEVVLGQNFVTGARRAIVLVTDRWYRCHIEHLAEIRASVPEHEADVILLMDVSNLDRDKWHRMAGEAPAGVEVWIWTIDALTHEYPGLRYDLESAWNELGNPSDFALAMWWTHVRAGDYGERNYEYVWKIDDDVRLCGTWAAKFAALDADEKLRGVWVVGALRRDLPATWWDTKTRGLALLKDWNEAANVPALMGWIVRLSAPALDMLHQALHLGRVGHIDILLPILCKTVAGSQCEMRDLPGAAHEADQCLRREFAFGKLAYTRLCDGDCHGDFMHPVRCDVFIGGREAGGTRALKWHHELLL